MSFVKATVRATRRVGAQQRFFSRSIPSERKVCVVGAAGGIGQPLSLLLKCSPLVSDLRLYDLAPFTPGVAADLSHIDTPAKVSGFVGGPEELRKALAGADVVVVPAGVPRKPGMTRDDLFNTNANIVKGIAEACGDACPDASLCIISNPVNSTVPIMAETLKKAGKYNPKKLFGVTTLDTLRANTFVAENQGTDVNETHVSVVGGHAGISILPLLSQVEGASFSDEDRAALTQRIMFGGDEVVQAKAGAGSATLSMAAAGARFALQVVRALNGEKGIKENAYVESDVASTQFFSSPLTLGVNGVEEIHDIGKINEFEQEKFDEMIPELQGSIDKGIAFVQGSK